MENVISTPEGHGCTPTCVSTEHKHEYNEYCIFRTVYDDQFYGREAKILGWGGSDKTLVKSSSLMPSCHLLEANIKVKHLSLFVKYQGQTICKYKVIQLSLFANIKVRLFANIKVRQLSLFVTQ